MVIKIAKFEIMLCLRSFSHMIVKHEFKLFVSESTFKEYQVNIALIYIFSV